MEKSRSEIYEYVLAAFDTTSLTQIVASLKGYIPATTAL